MKLTKFHVHILGGSESNGVLHSANFSSNNSGKNSHRKSLDKGDKYIEPYANGLAHQDYEYTEKSFKWVYFHSFFKNINIF